MKNTILSFLFCLLTVWTSFGQKCNFKLDKVDPITGKKAQAIAVKLGHPISVNFLRQGDSLYVEGLANLIGEQNFTIATGSLIDIKLGNDSILFLSSLADVSPSTSVINLGNRATIYSLYIMQYLLSQNQADLIKQYGIKFLRLHTQGNQAGDLPFDKKDTEKSITAAKCIY